MQSSRAEQCFSVLRVENTGLSRGKLRVARESPASSDTWRIRRGPSWVLFYFCLICFGRLAQCLLMLLLGYGQNTSTWSSRALPFPSPRKRLQAVQVPVPSGHLLRIESLGLDWPHASVLRLLTCAIQQPNSAAHSASSSWQVLQPLPIGRHAAASPRPASAPGPVTGGGLRAAAPSTASSALAQLSVACHGALGLLGFCLSPIVAAQGSGPLGPPAVLGPSAHPPPPSPPI